MVLSMTGYGRAEQERSGRGYHSRDQKRELPIF